MAHGPIEGEGRIGPSAGGTVIPFAPVAAAGALADDPLRALERYWQGLCDGRLMPCRNEVDPRALSDLLEHVVLIEEIAPGMSRIRIAGQRVNAIMGMDVRGMPLSSLFLPATRERLAEGTQALFNDPARVSLSMRHEGGRGRGLLLPLRGREGAVDRAIGVLTATGIEPDARAPQRMTIEAMVIETLIGYGERPTVPPRPGATGPRPKPRLRLVRDE